MTWKWLQRARELNLSISGPLIQEAARDFAEKLGKTTFATSNGWLDCFKQRHQIVHKLLSGESVSADLAGAQVFTLQIKDICMGHEPENIFNADETALFFRALPNKSLVLKYKKSNG